MSVGKFIVLEGIDGAGTTTQLHRLTGWLQGEGIAAHPTFEPSDGEIGQHIRRILRGQGRTTHAETVALMFAADRLEHLQIEILPRLESGTHVLCDRYVGSSLAYQGAHCDSDWVKTINMHAVQPDLTLYVRVSVETALARLKTRSDAAELYEKKETLAHIKTVYDSLYFDGAEARGNVIVVDGEPDPIRVFQSCRHAIEAILEEFLST